MWTILAEVAHSAHLFLYFHKGNSYSLLRDMEEVFFFRSDCQVAASVRHATLLFCAEGVNVQTRQA